MSKGKNTAFTVERGAMINKQSEQLGRLGPRHIEVGDQIGDLLRRDEVTPQRPTSSSIRVTPNYQSPGVSAALHLTSTPNSEHSSPSRRRDPNSRAKEVSAKKTGVSRSASPAPRDPKEISEGKPNPFSSEFENGLRSGVPSTKFVPQSAQHLSIPRSQWR